MIEMTGDLDGDLSDWILEEEVGGKKRKYLRNNGFCYFDFICLL